MLSALHGTGIAVRPESNSRHIIGDGPLRIVTDADAVTEHPSATCVDGLDPRQWALLRQLQRPGERLPLIVAGAVEGAFHVLLCAWVDAGGVIEVRSLDHAKALVASWDGTDPPGEISRRVQHDLESRAQQIVRERASRAASGIERARDAQLAAARLRLDQMFA